jgi:predicted PurR-regulated permease PerM
MLEGLQTRLQMMRSAWMSDLVVETPEPPTEFAPVSKAEERGESGAILIIVALLVFYFLYFASPILIPIVMALLLSMLLAPLVGLMGRLRVPRTLGSLIVVVTAVGSLFGIAASLSGPAQNWLTEPQRFVRLEEKLRPIVAPLEKLQYAVVQVRKAMAPTVGPEIQEVEVKQPGLAGLLSTGIGNAAFTIGAIITLLYMFLVSGDTFLRKLVLVTPLLQDKKRAVDIVRNIHIDISFYLTMVAAINIFIGFVVTAATAVAGIHDPFYGVRWLPC